jgi:hypothetical protein
MDPPLRRLESMIAIFVVVVVFAIFGAGRFELPTPSPPGAYAD